MAHAALVHAGRNEQLVELGMHSGYLLTHKLDDTASFRACLLA